jgi:Xaa-Pro aminopeptidase
MRRNGRPEETRLYCHSQGYDMVERPLVRFDETMTIEANMVLAVHPTYVTATTYSWACDNYLVTQDGVERLHRFPEVITELG